MTKLRVHFADNTAIDIVGDFEANISTGLPEVLLVETKTKRFLFNMRNVKYTESEEVEENED